MINAKSHEKKDQHDENVDCALANITRRILVIDDTPSLLKDYRKIFLSKPTNKEKNDLSRLEKKLFIDSVSDSPTHSGEEIIPNYKFELMTANRGKEGLKLCQQAVNKKNPFHLAFVDMRMPSGWNGIQTINAIDNIDKKIHFVLCTAYDDLTWSETIHQWLGSNDRILLLKKPFDYSEVWQLAVALTEKYLITEKANQKQQDLEKLVEARTSDLVKSKENLTHARNLAVCSNQTKNLFLSNVSHEILNPLNSVVSLVNLLNITKLNPEQSEMLQAMSSSTDNLLSIVFKLLDLSKIETGKLELKRMPFDFKKCISHTLFSFANKAKQKKIAFYYSIHPNLDGKAWGDVNRFRQIISNLLSNAVKFTEKGCIDFTIRTSSLTSWFKDLEIIIKDTGIGINDSIKSRIFEEFQRADSSIERYQEGSGLGLPICHYLAQQMGGNIDCKSVEKKGSEFTFQIPLEFDKEIISHSTQEAYQNCKKITINIIDPEGLTEPIIQFLKENHIQYKKFLQLDINPSEFSDDAPFVILVVSKIESTLFRSLRKTIDKNKGITFFFITPPFNKMDPSIREHIPLVGHLTFPLNLYNLLSGIEIVERTKTLTDVPPFIDSRTFSDRLNPTVSKINNLEDHQEQKMHILLADDNEINRQVGKMIIEALGLKITTCPDGIEVLKLIKSTDFDLIFMDCLMPIMDGYTTTKEIRKIEKNKKNIIVAMSASKDKGVLEKTLKYEMDDFIKKPIQPESIQKIIEKWIEK